MLVQRLTPRPLQRLNQGNTEFVRSQVIVRIIVRDTIWNRTRPRTHVQTQHTRDLISAQKASHKHNNKDLSHLGQLSPSGRVKYERYISSTKGTSHPPLVHPHTAWLWGRNSSGVYIPCIYLPDESYRRWLRSLLCLCDVSRALMNLVRWFFSLRRTPVYVWRASVGNKTNLSGLSCHYKFH